MRKIIILVASFLLLSCNYLVAQKEGKIQNFGLQGQSLIDSLLKELPYMKEDTNSVYLLSVLSFEFNSINPDEGIKYGELGLKLAEEIGWKEGKLKNYNSLGINYSFGKSNFPKALDYYLKALKIGEELGNRRGVGILLGNIGIIYDKLSDYPKALDYYFKALKMNEELGNRSGIALNYGNIGIIYRKQSNYPKAIEYYLKALNIDEESGNKSGIARQLVNIGNVYSSQSDYPKALEYYFKAIKIREELGDKSGIANSLGNIGIIYAYKSDYPKAIEYYHKSINISEELGDKSGVANNLGNIGIIYANQSDFPKALMYYHKALKINEELGDKSGIATNQERIGLIYKNQSDYPKALINYRKALKINEELGDKSGIATNLINIGTIHALQFDYTKTLEYYHQALKIGEELGDKSVVALTIGNIGIIYDKLSDYPKALEYYVKALKIDEDLENKSGVARHLANIGILHLSQSKDSIIVLSNNKNELMKNKEKNIEKSIEYLEKAIYIFKNSGESQQLSLALDNLSQAYQLKSDYKRAFESYREYKSLQDSIFSMDKQKEIANLESKRELEIKEKENQLLIKDNQLFNAELIQKNQKISLAEKDKEVQHLAFLKEQAEKQEKEKELSLSETQMKLQKSQIASLDKDKERQNAELKAKNLQRNFFIAGVIVFIILFLIAFIRFREKKKLSDKLALQNAEIEKQKNLVENQKNIVEEQKEILQEKNNEIYSSIRYASTIQNAILPWESSLKNSLGAYLLFYKPRDIVSGDSYWFQEVEGIKLLAVIDCTGHGIPGAMLTVIASTALDDAVLGQRLTDTSQILTYMNEKVTEVLNQRLAENKIRDGMEVALIAIHPDKIQFSGAGRPLYMKNGTIEIIKTDKRGIAGQADNDKYQFSSVEIEKTDNLILYLSSDGYADQMNENSKKYSTKRFLETLDKISEMPLEQQKEILENEFNSHKGNREQIDDVTVIGVRI